LSDRKKLCFNHHVHPKIAIIKTCVKEKRKFARKKNEKKKFSLQKMGNSKSCCIFANGSTPRHYRDPDKKSGKSNGHFRRSGSSGSGLAGSGNAQLGLDDANGQVSTNPGQGIFQFFIIKLEKTFLFNFKPSIPYLVL
jgi:hypothetical protein